VNRHVFLSEYKQGYTLAGMDYGQRLKAAREHAKLSQLDLAEQAGIRQPSVSHLENSSKATGSEFTARFARITGVSVDWLADEIGDMIPMTYQTTDPKIIAAAKMMEPLPEYAKDVAVKDVAQVAQLIERASHGGNGTDG
ncbi:MAG TPA: helix-turn-helix transcriptional regulator, partial [Rhodocyclaceae bacterium]|nr:helix-turn-helix transcriptional regulator [Rhodocyclaceae bacterium]